MRGIEKDFDNLGRVVVPKKFREKLGIEDNSTVIVSLTDDAIIISPKQKRCALCENKIKNERSIRVCDNCILKIKSI
ncbi:MAG: AbrB/MazE/SpoVT family DNA-binding domain-containing protein [Clostridia bacterium]|nr:AbrB/MazE/SpoVT family DNA-binding domain-containing protein [Clostridia bacterium]